MSDITIVERTRTISDAFYHTMECRNISVTFA